MVTAARESDSAKHLDGPLAAGECVGGTTAARSVAPHDVTGTRWRRSFPGELVAIFYLCQRIKCLKKNKSTKDGQLSVNAPRLA